MRFLRAWALPVIAAFLVAFGIQIFIARPFEIPSPSMEPTINVGDRVMVNRLSYQFGDIERGQVIVFDTPPGVESEEDFFIKRVIGLPGEFVQLRDDSVFIGRLRMIEPYVVDDVRTRPLGRPIPGCADAEPSALACTVPADHVFVLGDNRTSSEDSRVFGPVPIDTIVGRAAMRVWPLDGIGRL